MSKGLHQLSSPKGSLLFGNTFDFAKDPLSFLSFATADPLGLLAAIGSGTLFALEGMLAQTCFRQINPATFTSLVFTVKWLVLSGFALLIIHVSLSSYRCV